MNQRTAKAIRRSAAGAVGASIKMVHPTIEAVAKYTKQQSDHLSERIGMVETDLGALAEVLARGFFGRLKWLLTGR